METIRSRLQPHIDNRARLPAVLSRGILLDVEFLDRIDRQDRRRITSDAGAVNDALPRKRLTVIQAVDEIDIIFCAQTVRAGRGKSTAWIAHNSRPELQQVLVIAPVQRKIDDFFVAESPS